MIVKRTFYAMYLHLLSLRFEENVQIALGCIERNAPKVAIAGEVAQVVTVAVALVGGPANCGTTLIRLHKNSSN